MRSFAHRLLRRATPAFAALALTATVAFSAEPAGLLEFEKLPAPSAGGQCVEIQLPRNLINLASRIVGREEPEVAKLLAGIQSVRVNVVSVDDTNRAEVAKRISAVRTKLDQGGWQKVVTAAEKNQDVAIYLKTDAEDMIQGITVTVIDDSKEAVVINVVGSVDTDQIADLVEKLHLPKIAALVDCAKQ